MKVKDIKEKFYYDNGDLRFIKQCGTRGTKDKVSGAVDSRGYIQVKLCGKLQLAHRVIFMLHHGWLPDFIDHINGDKLDNRIDNLRPATSRQNAMNRKLSSRSASGVKGVNWHKQHKKWCATISDEKGKRKHLGLFTNKLDAIKARQKAELLYYGPYIRGD